MIFSKRKRRGTPPPALSAADIEKVLDGAEETITAALDAAVITWIDFSNNLVVVDGWAMSQTDDAGRRRLLHFLTTFMGFQPFAMIERGTLKPIPIQQQPDPARFVGADLVQAALARRKQREAAAPIWRHAEESNAGRV